MTHSLDSELSARILWFVTEHLTQTQQAFPHALSDQYHGTVPFPTCLIAGRTSIVVPRGVIVFLPPRKRKGQVERNP
jgi:hypothetical protein